MSKWNKNDYCPNCCQLETYAGRITALCKKHRATDEYIELLKMARQTLLNLANGELTGDARAIAINAASRISITINLTT